MSHLLCRLLQFHPRPSPCTFSIYNPMNNKKKECWTVRIQIGKKTPNNKTQNETKLNAETTQNLILNIWRKKQHSKKVKGHIHILGYVCLQYSVGNGKPSVLLFPLLLAQPVRQQPRWQVWIMSSEVWCPWMASPGQPACWSMWLGSSAHPGAVGGQGSGGSHHLGSQSGLAASPKDIVPVNPGINEQSLCNAFKTIAQIMGKRMSLFLQLSYLRYWEPSEALSILNLRSPPIALLIINKLSLENNHSESNKPKQ